MSKKHLFTKSICCLALAATLIASNGFTAFAKPNIVDTVPLDEYVDTIPLDEYAVRDGMLSFEVTYFRDGDDYYFTPESTFKLNCIDADHLPLFDSPVPLSVVIFFPDSTMQRLGIKVEDLIPFDIYGEEDENFNIRKDVYVRSAPYHFEDAVKFVTPELVAAVNQYGSGKLFMGVSGTNEGFELGGNGRYLEWNHVVPTDFILDDDQPASAETTPSAILPSESQEAVSEVISDTTAETPVQTNGTDLIYTTVKYDTLGVVALNYYGSYAASRQLYEANRDILKQNGNKLKEGIQLNLPAVLGSYTLIAPPQITGDESLYCVKSGDTLRTIAQKVYGDSSLYQNLFERNKDRIKDANHIYEGLIIVCP